MRRISIRTLMAFVLVSAVGLAALRNANELWAGMMLPARPGRCRRRHARSSPHARPGTGLVAGFRRAWLADIWSSPSAPWASTYGTTHLWLTYTRSVVHSRSPPFEVLPVDTQLHVVRLVTTMASLSERTVANSVMIPPRAATISPRWKPGHSLAIRSSGRGESRPVSARRPLPLRPPGRPGGRDGRRVVLGEAGEGASPCDSPG